MILGMSISHVCHNTVIKVVFYVHTAHLAVGVPLDTHGQGSVFLPLPLLVKR